MSWSGFTSTCSCGPGSLDAQLQRDARLSLFSYLVLAGLSEAPEHTMPMSELAIWANGSLPRLSHAVTSLERRGWVYRSPAPGNRRITMATLTESGNAKLVATAPKHVEAVRRYVLDTLSDAQMSQLGEVSKAILGVIAGPHALEVIASTLANRSQHSSE